MPSLTGTLQRIRAMDGAELRFRASVALRNAADRARLTVRSTAWDLADLRFPVRGHAEVAEYLRNRPARFPLAPQRLGDITASILARFGNAGAVAAGDRILNGRYHLLGYEDVPAGSPPNWHRDPVHGREAPRLFWESVPFLDPACGDHKVTWELNRHQHFLVLGRAFRLTGDDRYYHAFVRQLTDWIDGNPPLRGINWASMLELAFRSLSWLWALHLFIDRASSEDDQPWLPALLLALDRQLRHIEHNLSRYFSPNTHLTGEALALYVAGQVLPELGDGTRRAAIGRSILLAEARRQVNADGGHAELSAHYHRYSTDFYLLALNIARLTGDPAAGAFEEAARRQAEYLRTIADDTGQLPLIGDDDGGQLFPICGAAPADARETLAHAAVLLQDATLAVGEAPEATHWFCANARDMDRLGGPGAPWPSRALAASGYCVSRNTRGDHLVFDCGPHGFLNGGHAHADALSIVLTIAGVPFLVDPGTATYTMDLEQRDRFRSGAMHNTVVLNGREHAVPRGPFHWASRTDARCTAWRSRAGLDYAEGCHDGYAPIVHRRRVVAIHGIGWAILDHLEGPATAAATASAMWHVHPIWQPSTVSEGIVELAGPAGATTALASSAPLATADARLALYAPVYGRLEAAPCFMATITGPLPLALLTFVPASPEWTPVAVAPAEQAGGYDVETASGRISITSIAELEPVIDIKAGLAQTVHRE